MHNKETQWNHLLTRLESLYGIYQPQTKFNGKNILTLTFDFPNSDHTIRTRVAVVKDTLEVGHYTQSVIRHP